MKFKWGIKMVENMVKLALIEKKKKSEIEIENVNVFLYKWNTSSLLPSKVQTPSTPSPS